MDIETYTKSVTALQDTLYRVAKSLLTYDCDCEDAVQEAILKSYAKLSALRQEEYFNTWLVRILINECYRLLRRRTKQLPLEEWQGTEPSHLDEYRRDLYDALMALPQKIRVTVVLYYVEGYSVSEIRNILHIPEGTVKSRLSRGRTLLKDQWESEELEDETELSEKRLSVNTN